MTARAGLTRAIAADPVLMAILTGGAWDRPVNRDSTPAAFDQTQAGKPILPCVSVADGGAQADSTGPFGAVASGINLWFRATDSADGKAAVDAAVDRFVLLFNGLVIDTDAGGAMVEVASSFEGNGDPFVQGARFRVVQVRCMEVW